MGRIRTVGLVVKRDRPRAARLAHRMIRWLRRRGIRALLDAEAGLRGEPAMDKDRLAREADALLTIDGQEGTRLARGDVIEVRQGRSPVALVRSPHRTYYDVLRSKLGWGVR